MSSIKFDIIEYLSGLTGFVLDKAVLNRIALERGIDTAESIYDLTEKMKDLALADELFVVVMSPDSSASMQQSHGSYRNSIGSQSLSPKTRQQLYNQMYNIYSKYNDEKLKTLQEGVGCLKFLDM